VATPAARILKRWTEMAESQPPMSESQPPEPEAAHDILAAEEFGVPAPDPDLHRREPVILPDDPSGIAEPHDILAAEAFAMPAVHHHPEPPTLAERARSVRGMAQIAAAFAAAFLLARLLRRGVRAE
jgi:hypothetical protein